MYRFITFLLIVDIGFYSYATNAMEKQCSKEQAYISGSTDIGASNRYDTSCYLSYEKKSISNFKMVSFELKGIEIKEAIKIKGADLRSLNAMEAPLLVIADGLLSDKEASRICSIVERNGGKILLGGVYSLPEYLYTGRIELTVSEVVAALHRKNVKLWDGTIDLQSDFYIVAQNNYSSYLKFAKKKSMKGVYITSASTDGIKKHDQFIGEISKQNSKIPRRYSCN